MIFYVCVCVLRIWTCMLPSYMHLKHGVLMLKHVCVSHNNIHVFFLCVSTQKIVISQTMPAHKTAQIFFSLLTRL
jgi:hypothetical protein